ncbi:holo-ACP synthase [Shouchella shacheensis]|uniref:holo-ACP synthase n=1 Tax=Shouchella shacheensis TaxID=1649580 RepID=UPI00074049C5|nr:holo-ACP synthase [Shouchella shacheensis]
MIIGTGIDIIELTRIQMAIDRNRRFAARILTQKELDSSNELKDKRYIEFVAGRFAAKEAFVKAIGTGIGQAFSFQDIHILSDEHGKPYIVAAIEANTHVSISHSKDYAVASVIIEN